MSQFLTQNSQCVCLGWRTFDSSKAVQSTSIHTPFLMNFSANLLFRYTQFNPSSIMKTIPLIAACLTILSTAATAQVTGSALVDNSKSTSVVHDTFESGPSAQPSGEFAPLNNEPFLPGGKEALEKHIKALDLYPYLAREIKLEGTVRVKFRVQPSGYVTDVQLVKSRGSLLDVAAINVVTKMPRWYPAHRAGIAVSRLVELPITFRLD